MSFSMDVKDELRGILPNQEHCARAELSAVICPDRAVHDPYLLDQVCCKRSFLRGFFLSTGYIGDPEREYQLELTAESSEVSDLVVKLLNSFSISAKTVERKGHFVVYLKEGDQIVHFLGLMGAGKAVMALENVRVVKDVRNSINRKVNCETANLNKTVAASLKQSEEIQLIIDQIGLENLPVGLQEIAELRLANPEASLAELGELMNPPISKSAVNHRLRKLKEIAEEEKL